MRKIIHIDMDCFYASVEIKHRPELAGKPLAVGGPPDTRSVICTANYEARKFGVRAAIPSSRAVRLCANLVLVSPQFELYKEESRAIRKIFENYTDKIEPLSLDEAYLDVTDFCAGQTATLKSASLVAKEIRQKIFSERSLTASAGIAPNKFLAKIASDWRKPNNQFTLRPEDIDAFMPELPVEKIFGVGPVTKKQLNDVGLMNCADIQKLDLLTLRKIFGRRATEMQKLCRGQDDREVKAHSVRKSLTVEETFNKDLNSLEELLENMAPLYEDFLQRLNRGRHSDRIKSWVIKLKYFDFQSTTHESASKQIPSLENFQQLLQHCYSKKTLPVRLLSLGVRLVEDSSSESPQLIFF